MIGTTKRLRRGLTITRAALLIVVTVCQMGYASAASAGHNGSLEGLRSADERLAATLFRLIVANNALCPDHMAATGLVLHDLAAYDPEVRPEAQRYFDFEGPVGIEAVVPGSPADLAGLRANDSIVAVNGASIGGEDPLVSVRDAIGHADAVGVSLTVVRGGRRNTFLVRPVAACDARGEVKVTDDLNAQTDGDLIQVDSGLMNLVADPQEFSAVVAHELAHIVLDHPRRLTEAHVSRGLLKGIGRNARLIKQTENEADRLSVTLMANAGYDPKAAVRYWLVYGPQLKDHGGFGSTHSSWQERVKLISLAASQISAQQPRPIIPNWINSRTQPLD